MTSWKSLSCAVKAALAGVLVVCLCGGELGAAQAPPSSLAPLVRKAAPGVVNIIANKVIKTPAPEQMPFDSEDPYQEFFERFFGGPMPNNRNQDTLGSGFIIDPAGLILTNNHVVEDSTELKVKLVDEREYMAQIVGRDPKTDTALIRIEADGPLTALPLGDSDALEVGDWVVAIGNPFGLGNTVTCGIVSAKYRRIGIGDYDNFIQTDAPINPGNSGGPLLDLHGQVVGINSVIFTESAGNIGIGFAIPINMVEALLPQLRQGKVRRPFLGVMIQNVTPALRQKLSLATDSGALVSDVIDGSPAAKAGVRRGDVIVSFDGKPVRISHDLPLIIGATPIDRTVAVEIMRGQQRITLSVVTQEMAEEPATPQDVLSAEETDAVGLTLQALSPAVARELGVPRSEGLLVIEVAPDGSAAEAGLQPGDVILEVDQQPVTSVEALRDIIRRQDPPGTLLLLVDREGNTVFITLTVSLPAS